MDATTNRPAAPALKAATAEHMAWIETKVWAVPGMTLELGMATISNEMAMAQARDRKWLAAMRRIRKAIAGIGCGTDDLIKVRKMIDRAESRAVYGCGSPRDAVVRAMSDDLQRDAVAARDAAELELVARLQHRLMEARRVERQAHNRSVFA